MSRRHAAFIAIVLGLGVVAAGFAQQAPAPTPHTPPDPERPEYRARRLPTDVFKPSEQVQEDTPVAFPEDI